MSAWLWPDHVIGKRESRTMREEHNTLVTSYDILATAARGVVASWECGDLAMAVRLLAEALKDNEPDMFEELHAIENDRPDDFDPAQEPMPETIAKIPVRGANHEQNLRDILTTAVESGIGYWAHIIYRRRTDTGEYLSIIVRDAEDCGGNGTLVDLNAIDRAVAQIVERGLPHASAFVGWKYRDGLVDVDAEAADVAVQVAAFGEVVFG